MKMKRFGGRVAAVFAALVLAFVVATPVANATPVLASSQVTSSVVGATASYGTLRFANTANNTARISVENNVVVFAGNTMVIRNDTSSTTSAAATVTVTVTVNDVYVQPTPLEEVSVAKYGNTGQLNYTTYCNLALDPIAPGQPYTVVITASAPGYQTIVDRYTVIVPDWVKYFPVCSGGPVQD